jgi:hypothetical protein
MVFIGSVLQGNSEYNISNSNLVFGTAPVSNDEIIVYTIGDSGPQGATGAQGTLGVQGATGGAAPTNNPGSTRDLFTANGSSNTFTLSVTPTSEQHTFVFVGTILQGNADYNISNNQVIFTTTPASNDEIIVYTIGDSGPQGPTGTQGAIGAQGTFGTQGTLGVQGASGATGVSLGLVIAIS